MLAKILGYIFVLAGILFLLKPQILKNKLQKKGLRKLRKYMFFLLVFLGVAFIGVARNFHGLWAIVFTILGIIGIFKGIFFLKAKAADKLITWLAAQPLNLFRIGGCAYIILGIILLSR